MRVALALDEEASSPAGLSWTLTGMTSPESGAPGLGWPSPQQVSYGPIPEPF